MRSLREIDVVVQKNQQFSAYKVTMHKTLLTDWLWLPATLPLPFGAGVLPPSAEASSGPNAYLGVANVCSK